MMGLANGKVNEAAARLTLANEMLEVRVQGDPGSIVHSIQSYFQSMKKYSESESPINLSLSDKVCTYVYT